MRDLEAEELGSGETKRKHQRGPRLREASLSDYEQIAALESRYGLTAAKTFEEWRHLWQGNPVYRRLQPGWSMGWVLEDEDQQVVGSLGSIPRAYELDGRSILAVSSRGWVADPKYRSASLMLLDQLINQPGADLFLTNTNSVASAPAVNALQCRPVPVGKWNEYAFWITDYQGYLERSLRRRGNRVAKALSYPFAAAVFLRDRLTKPALHMGKTTIDTCSGFDERFDEFWDDLKRRSPHLLLAVRTREVLDWHYKFGLLNGRVWILAVLEGSRIVAYAVFEKKQYPGGLKQVRLVDFQSLEAGDSFLSALLARALRQCREEGIHRLVSIGRWLEQGEWLDRMAPYRRTLPVWVYFYRANHPWLEQRLQDRAVWAPSLFDGDASLLR